LVFISLLQVVGSWPHVSTVCAVLFRPCCYNEKCRRFSPVLARGDWDRSILCELVLMC